MYYPQHAWMVELVDTLDSKSGFCKEVGVRVPLQACLMSIDISYISIITEKSGQNVRIFLLWKKMRQSINFVFTQKRYYQ